MFGITSILNQTFWINYKFGDIILNIQTLVIKTLVWELVREQFRGDLFCQVCVWDQFCVYDNHGNIYVSILCQVNWLLLKFCIMFIKKYLHDFFCWYNLRNYIHNILYFNKISMKSFNLNFKFNKKNTLFIRYKLCFRLRNMYHQFQLTLNRTSWTSRLRWWSFVGGKF